MPNIKYIFPLAICIFLSGCFDSTPKFSGNSNYDASEFDDEEYMDSDSESYEAPNLESVQNDGSASSQPVESVQHGDPEENVEDEGTESVAELSNDFQPTSATSYVFVNMLRVWKDSKNEFSTTAELMAVAENTREVRLLKQNGVVITVPYEILSDHDKNYVTEFISAERQRVSRPTPQLVDVFE